MRVLFVSSEAAPFAKSGGLGDVIGSLPGELRKQGVEAEVILPLYRSIKQRYGEELTYVTCFRVPLAWRRQYAGLFRMEYEGVPFWFLDNEQYFDRDGYYGYFDDGERFAYFSRAVLEALSHMEDLPRILHCSEWQTALTPVYLKTLYAGREGYGSLRTVFTIHNIEYQGEYDPWILGDVLGLSEREGTLVKYNGDVNYMKGAIVACDKLTTVSPSYAGEIQEAFFAHGLERIIRENSYKLSGIINGIDRKLFNPAKDKALPYHYTYATKEKKALNKAALQRELGLAEDGDVPLVAMVGRMAPHKGLDLVRRVFREMMEEPIQFAILGTGDKKYEDFFLSAQNQYPGRAAARLGFAADLASRMYSGADLFLMPSVSEPCGLAQMIAMRYGTIPIVRETGGLKDSVEAFNPQTGKGNGITFATVNAHDMLGAVKRGLELYRDPVRWQQLVKNAF
ncbi:MAG: glycogen/starch synthase, partial [Bacillota bacterium]|nr:glycogen/starch synthase [Bacillota bacterium]